MTTLCRKIAASLVLVLLPLVVGCSMGYSNLRPGENSALYQSLFQDVINTYDEPYWLWVRGVIPGDLDGNGTVEEEIVLATIQQGTHKNPGPIEMAFVVAARVNPDGSRTALARTMLFDSNPVPGASRPVNDLGVVDRRPFTRCRAQMVQDKITLKETVVVYFWSDPTPSSVWYAGFALEDGKLVKNLETAMWQGTPGFLTVNLDRGIEANPFGYQLAFSVAAIPSEIFGKLGRPSEAPLWGHVYARNVNGHYDQADERYGGHYREIENGWNQYYLKAVMNGLPNDELAWFEYHMSMLNHYTGDIGMAAAYLEKAQAHARDPILVDAIARFAESVRRDEP